MTPNPDDLLAGRLQLCNHPTEAEGTRFTLRSPAKMPLSWRSLSSQLPVHGVGPAEVGTGVGRAPTKCDFADSTRVGTAVAGEGGGGEVPASKGHHNVPRVVVLPGAVEEDQGSGWDVGVAGVHRAAVP